VYKATYSFKGNNIWEQRGLELSEFPKKNSKYKIKDKLYKIEKFTIIGENIIYNLVDSQNKGDIL